MNRGSFGRRALAAIVSKPVGAIGEAGRDYAQDVRYIAKEHMDVRRD